MPVIVETIAVAPESSAPPAHISELSTPTFALGGHTDPLIRIAPRHATPLAPIDFMTARRQHSASWNRVHDIDINFLDNRFGGMLTYAPIARKLEFRVVW